MDKYLMSSPTQLSQPFEASNDSFHLGLDLADYESSSNDKHYNAEVVPVSNNSKSFIGTDYDAMNLMAYPNANGSMAEDATLNGDPSDSTYMDDAGFGSASTKFSHSKNVSLDDGIYSSQLLSNQFSSHKASHQSNLSTSSMISMSQDPPMYLDYSKSTGTSDFNNIHSSFSNNTIYSMESIPQLSSSVSNHSLSDSPSSQQTFNKPSLAQQIHLHQPVVATPRRIGRNKSLSVSSMNNLFNTPMRGHSSAALSPVNLAGNPSSKVTKTPHSKPKGHSRSRSKMSLDTPVVLGATKSSSFQNLAGNANLNPFYTPSTFVSPRVDQTSGDIDDIGTPLPTPSSNRNTAVSAVGSFLSPSNNWTNPSTTNFGTPFPLKRTETLESIKIEDQDDDALKQLKKAKSLSSFPQPGLKMKKDSFPHTDLTQLATKLSSTTTIQDLEDIVSSNSTPGVYYSSTSPSHTFGKPLTYSDAKSYSVPTTSTEYADQINGKPGIDLMLAQFATEGANKMNRRPMVAAFTKSYPASIDLASIATSPMDASLSAPTTLSQQYQQSMRNPTPLSAPNSGNGSVPNGAALLPPMATFSTQAEFLNDQYQGTPPSMDLLQLDSKSQVSVPSSSITQLRNMSKIDIPIVKNNRADKDDKKEAKKKHKCPICEARFQRPEHVKRHMKSHSSEKPYQCDQPACGKRFNRKDNLKAHLKKIHQRQV
ncbi:uncharacterized protein CANTADRAFT_87707 [Suhomyces tanzawaensis NRRL Y-17324]|uniref:pH-response transcription factor pacC/RIM101 n=1 Tax=Suhomyces tanzawaensis NRRL Y-17324 TaxID=984487 RepID=A0A1E4SQF6_9ASCO|nr:uncharacterized protein CANTADRAFT_87707 [Suhomyces tanzawaensis NRRL Y-17324]ODV81744.1 hypothetical protein CANTADRAFT_87707 [Suhomyces tanzawaensis NRRL Y-17324]